MSFSSSSEELASISDLLILIFLCLPARSLIRFKSVSKKWRYLISETRFHTEHVSCNPKLSLSGLYYIWDKNPIPLQGHSLPTLAFTGKPTPYLGSRIVDSEIHDSRHGLLLCSYYSSSDILQIVVCNPTTQKHNIFHQRALYLSARRPFSLFFLHFDPSVSLVYKLVLIRDNTHNYEVHVCASNSSTWKTIFVEAERAWGRLSEHGVLSSDGVVYVITDKWYLVQFDIDTENLSADLTTHEPEVGRYSKIRYFGEHACGNLVLIVSRISGLDFKIYEMEKRKRRNWVLAEELCSLHGLWQPILGSHLAVLRMFWGGDNEDKDLTLFFTITTARK